MSISSKQFRTLSFSILFTAAPALAQAQDIPAALDRLKALSAEQGVELDWSSEDISGSDVVLSDVVMVVEGEDLPIGDITLTGISESDTGYSIEELSLAPVTAQEEEFSVAIEGVGMTGIELPKEGEDTHGDFAFYETATVESVVVSMAGTEVFTLTDLHAEITPPEGDNAMAFDAAAESFTIDLSVIEDPNQRQVLQALGYEQLQGDMQMAGTWQPGDGRMALSQYNLTVADAGTLGFNFDVGGYTPEFIKSMTELQQQMAESTEEEQSAHGLAMLGLMQQLTFHEAEIAFTDDSLTGKILNYVAERQGMSADAVANQAKAIMPFALAQLNNPELTKMVTEAVSNFLDDPQSLRITATPNEPVPFALIMAGAMSAPENLPQTLGVTVTAND